MHWYFNLVIFIRVCLPQSTASPESCYFCMGTPQCENPIDYNEVSPRACLSESVCVKYISSSQNIHKDVGIQKLTYRQCMKPYLLDESICTFMKASQEKELLQMNHLLTDFQCSICNDTNCNLSTRNVGSILTWTMTIICLLLNMCYQ